MDSTAAGGYDAHPSIGGLTMLVFEAVMEVVCVSLPGYIIARRGGMDPDKQKFLANLNVSLFTPCLIFSKLAAQLTPGKLSDLAIIPIIFVIQTLVSYLVSVGVAKVFRFGRRPANFITAMGVFGNSNSLPISLVISLSGTLKGLHWDKIPGDSDSQVAARGILYLLIFQQLGQLVRWSWGYHVLLAPKSKYPEYQNEAVEEGRYRDNTSQENLISGLEDDGADADTLGSHESSEDSDVYNPAGRTPVAGTSSASPNDSDDDSASPRKQLKKNVNGVSGANGHFGAPNGEDDDIMSFPRMRDLAEEEVPGGVKGCIARSKAGVARARSSMKASIVKAYGRLPQPIRTKLAGLWNFLVEFMNPPLWAMLISIVVASIPSLQKLFFQQGTFVNNSVTRAVNQSAGVAVPLILVVLGANLANNTKESGRKDSEEGQIGTRLLVASLISRMVIPTIIMAPILAITAKFIPVSILDDPIFIIVCFLLVGAPSALQLAQICQINEVYESVMSKILFQSYVVWILPSTLVLVMLALETLEWAR
ncbi:auxin efflux carrier [Xylariomycetidae sp. FL0641]|nr:auxin efflux carrier [Xylariomycetidae sp. FL0641]